MLWCCSVLLLVGVVSWLLVVLVISLVWMVGMVCLFSDVLRV